METDCDSFEKPQGVSFQKFKVGSKIVETLQNVVAVWTSFKKLL